MWSQDVGICQNLWWGETYTETLTYWCQRVGLPEGHCTGGFENFHSWEAMHWDLGTAGSSVGQKLNVSECGSWHCPGQMWQLQNFSTEVTRSVSETTRFTSGVGLFLHKQTPRKSKATLAFCLFKTYLLALSQSVVLCHLQRKLLLCPGALLPPEAWAEWVSLLYRHMLNIVRSYIGAKTNGQRQWESPSKH